MSTPMAATQQSQPASTIGPQDAQPAQEAKQAE